MKSTLRWSSLLLIVWLALFSFYFSCDDDDDDDDNDAGGDKLSDGYHSGLGYIVTDEETGMRLLFPDAKTLLKNDKTTAAAGSDEYNTDQNVDIDHFYAELVCKLSGDMSGEKWTLPTISQLRDWVDGCPEVELGGLCGVTDDCATLECTDESCQFGCAVDFSGPGPDGCYTTDTFFEGICGNYWSSTELHNPDFPEYHYFWLLSYGAAVIYANISTFSEGMRVLCVENQP